MAEDKIYINQQTNDQLNEILLNKLNKFQEIEEDSLYKWYDCHIDS